MRPQHLMASDANTQKIFGEKKMPPENMNSREGQNSKAPQDAYLTEGCALECRKAFQERGERQEDESGDASE